MKANLRAVANAVQARRRQGMGKGASVAATMRQFGVSQTFVYNAVQARGKCPHLEKPAKKPPVRAEIAPEAWQFFKSDYLRLEQPTAAACYRAVCRKFGKQPSIATFKRRLAAEVPQAVVMLGREGEVETLNKILPALQRSVGGIVAGTAINGDGYKHNCFVVAPDGEIYRPVTWAWQCVRSRKILAHRTAVSENADTLRLSFLDVCRATGVPQKVVIDSTRAAANKWMTNMAPGRKRFKNDADAPRGVFVALGVQLVWTKIDRQENGRAKGRARSKPIERAFRDFDDLAKEFSGAYAGRSPTTKPANYEVAVIPEEVFKRRLNAWITEFNAQTGRRSHAMDKPGRDSYDAVFARHYDAARMVSLTAEDERLLLLAGETRKVAVDGTLTLTAGSLAGLPRNRYWAEFLQAHAGKRLTVRFDPQDLHDEVHVYDGKKYLGAATCELPQGFFSTEAARDAARHRNSARKALKKQLAHHRGEADAIDRGTTVRRTKTTPSSRARARAATPPKEGNVVVPPARPASGISADIISYYQQTPKGGETIQ